jgi:hypothetical protein
MVWICIYDAYHILLRICPNKGVVEIVPIHHFQFIRNIFPTSSIYFPFRIVGVWIEICPAEFAAYRDWDV